MGQNLVPNGSFETYSACPDNSGQIYRAIPWFQPLVLGNNDTIASSSDFFHECSPNPFFSVPHNDYAGTQPAKTGKGYSGIAVYGGNDYREYIEVKLTSTLQQGRRYCVQFFISLADTSQYASDNLSAYFSSDSIKYSIPVGNYILPFQPQITNTGGIIANKNDWTLVSGSFIANGNENYLTLGSFVSNSNTSWQDVGGETPFAYYYIDDVSVVECDTVIPPQFPTESSITIPNVFTPNGDGINDVFIIESTGIEGMSCEIFNRWGIKVATLSQLNEGWDGRTTSGQEAIEGVYYYVVTAKGTDSKEHRKTGFIQLLR